MPFRFKGWSGNWLTNQSMPISNGTRYENGKNIINHLSITVGRNYNNVFNFLNFKWFAFLERSFPTTPINRARQFLNHELNHFLWLSNRFPSFFRLLRRTVRRGNLSDRLSYLTEMACLLSRRKWIMASGKFTGAGFFSLSEERSGVCGARSPHCEPAVTGRPPLSQAYWVSLASSSCPRGGGEPFSLRPLSMTEPGNEVTLAHTQTGRAQPNTNVTRVCFTGIHPERALWIHVRSRNTMIKRLSYKALTRHYWLGNP